ncbi:TniQ family protein [Billgrantia sulfidoxydans]|uniref:TniQ family protein n=1 Tax=Billgrantia sulfidoxydans TaxID=2733484 RepID=A0ABX7W4Z9_9GAMM|nr:TniQ family protein [Halomonas sulfidoxydans]QTP54687.1 TniQ family protein [Halomonas sulfidoxydans]
MQLLVRPKPFTDESLESYLLRLAEANFLETYRLLSGAVKEWLQEQDHEAGGAFPLELKTVNIWHARQSSSFRVRALSLFEKLTDNEDLPLLALSLRNSAADFCGNYRAVARGGEHIPRCFLRKSIIPICPLCLEENRYIPQAWHYLTYTACTKHHVNLIYDCPSCGSPISYLENELIDRCRCGYDLSLAPVTRADRDSILLSEFVSEPEVAFSSPLPYTSSISIRNAALLYFCIVEDTDLDNAQEVIESLRLAIRFYSKWPGSYTSDLSKKLIASGDRLVKSYNKTPLEFAWGKRVSSACLIRGMRPEENFVLKEILSVLFEVVESNPKSKKSNYGDMLLTVKEAAVLLQTTHEQVYLLLEDGYLQPAYRVPVWLRMHASQPIFYLRQVVELVRAKMPADFGAAATYLPHW